MLFRTVKNADLHHRIDQLNVIDYFCPVNLKNKNDPSLWPLWTGVTTADLVVGCAVDFSLMTDLLNNFWRRIGCRDLLLLEGFHLLLLA